MSYTIDDFKQAVIGSFIAVIVFFAIRGGNPFQFDAKIGFAITAILVWIYYNGFQMKSKDFHFVVNLGIVYVICSAMAIVFGLADYNIIKSFDVFGSLVIVGVWIAFPVALIFDRFDFSNPLKRYYVRGK